MYTVHCAFLDASKAFDKVVHEGVLSELMERCAPQRLVRIIKELLKGNCYSILGNAKSVHGNVGVKQGGVISPLLYNLYVDRIVLQMELTGAGCYYKQRYMGVMLYADDIVLMAPSAPGLQKLINAFLGFTKERDISVNVAKSAYLHFGKSMVEHMKMGSRLLQRADTYKYLGIELRSGAKFSCSIAMKIKSFLNSANGLLCKASMVNLGADPKALFHLFKCYCVPVLTYGRDVIYSKILKGDMNRLKVAYNSCVRRIFHISRMESVPAHLSFETHCM